MSQQNIHTPPASDRSSHGKAGEEDDKDDEADVAASSSDLSDLDDQFEADAPPPSKVEPDRYEGGIPIFQPVRHNMLPNRKSSLRTMVDLADP